LSPEKVVLEYPELLDALVELALERHEDELQDRYGVVQGAERPE
jgi:hypothetical protein